MSLDALPNQPGPEVNLSQVQPKMPETPFVPPAETKAAISILQTGEKSDPDSTLKKIDKMSNDSSRVGEAQFQLGKQPSGSEAQKDGTQKTEQKAKRDTTQMQQQEAGYMARTHEKFKGQLEGRFEDPSTEAAHVLSQIDADAQIAIDKANAAGIDYSHEAVLSELSGKAFDQETAVIILAKAQERVGLLFNSEHASMNPEKQRIVAQQTEQYISLLSAAQVEGSMQDLKSDAVLRLVDENIAKLAYQDRAATENWLGDHGVRHLVDHNISVSMKLADEMERNGLPLTAAEKLILHQTMIDHDMGYAMDIVRKPINQGGFGADGGHNVLGAKFVRQQLENSDSTLSQVFTEEQLAVVHQGILEHDSRDVNLTLESPTPEQRNENLYSIIHTADNTHAFEDKLPEILYGHADTLRVMRLMKTAGEVGDEVAIEGLKLQLQGSIDARTDISSDDKQALRVAANTISAGSYQKSVPRICGNKPEFSIEGKVVHIEVTESAIHQEVMGMFDKDSEQLAKFIGDTAGVKNVDLGTTDSVVSPEGTVVISLRTGEARATEKSDYQQQIEDLISEPTFRDFVIKDGKLSLRQKYIEAKAKEAQEGSEDSQKRGTQIEEIKKQRLAGLQKFLPQTAAPINEI